MYKKLLATVFGLFMITGLVAAPSASAATPSVLSVYEHHYPQLGALYQEKYQYADCDTVGYKYTATQPGNSSSITLFASTSTLHCNSVFVISRSGTVAEYCVNRTVPILNFPAFVNDNLKQFGVRYRSACRLY